MPKPKTTRLQPRFDPTRSGPPEMIELVDPRWILKALGITLAVGILCAVLTILFFSHYAARHTKPSTTSQPAKTNP
jgi:hypothetical protein